MDKKPFETRSYNFELRAIASERGEGVRTITGRPIVYNSRTDLGWFDEIIDPGALNGTNLNDVRFLVNHDISRIPLARSRRNNANSTLRLMPDDNGMVMEADVDTENNATARELVSAVDRGDISGMSFMFTIDDEEWQNLESDHPLRRIKKIGSVIEVSAVTFPAYEDTEIKARDKEALESARRELESAREARNKETLESDKKRMLEIEKLKITILSKRGN